MKQFAPDQIAARFHMGQTSSEGDVAAAASPLQVLIIDDNEVDRHLFRRFLQDHTRPDDLECVECERGRSAMDEFRRLQPSCVLLDLNLPDIDGLDLLRSILREPDPCPVIVITAYGSEQAAVEAMKSGAADYLVKDSITGGDLAHVVKHALEKHALEREVERQRQALKERNQQLEAALERERAARNAVEESEFRYRTLAESMPQLVWTADHPGGEWDYVNERWMRLTGTPTGRALGSAWLEFIDSEDRQRVKQAWESALAQVVPVELECRIHATTISRWQLMRAVPVVQDGRPLKWLGTFTDGDDQRRTEELLRHRQKLESIGILAGGVAHDFNNLLVGIIGGVSYALESLGPDHELAPILDGAFKAGERAAQLTRQMLAYAGKGRLQVEDVDFRQNLQATWDLIQASLPRSIDLTVTIPPELPPIHTDPSQLQQIIMNLILNASEAIPAELPGRVVVRAETKRIDAPRRIWSGDLAAGEYVAIEVHDNGSGIAPEVLDRIFDPFFTTKFTGRGLGLAAVLGIVRSNKGAIEVTSTPGSGSTFRVLLPAGAPRVEGAIPAERPAPAAAAGGRILIVDDEPIVRNTARAVLERSGHAVEVVSSGYEALERLARRPAFSIVLLDLNMPGLDGRQTLDAIRRMHPDLPVVITSGYSESELRSRFERSRISGFLQKPFRARALSDKVAEVVSLG
jgi:PAS domain S-box-containing protein